MDRSMGSWLGAELEGVSDVTLSVAVAADAERVTETLAVTLDGEPVPLVELVDDHQHKSS